MHLREHIIVVIPSELKPQFNIPQHGTNISGHPELLQGIYNFNPTVFNTPRRTGKYIYSYHITNKFVLKTSFFCSYK